MPDKKKPVKDMSFPSQVAEMASLAIQSVNRNYGGGARKRKLDRQMNEAELGRRRKNQSADW